MNCRCFLHLAPCIYCFQVCSLASLSRGLSKVKGKTSTSSNTKNQIERNLILKPRLRNRARKPNSNRPVRWKPPRPHPSLKKRKESDPQLSNKIVSALKGTLKQKRPSKESKKGTTKAPAVGWMTVDTFKIGPPTKTPSISIRGFSTTQYFDLSPPKSTTFKPVTMAPYQGTPSPPFSEEGDDRLWKISGTPLKSKASISLIIGPWREWIRDRFDFGIQIANPFASVRNMAAKAADQIRNAILQFRHKVWTSCNI